MDPRLRLAQRADVAQIQRVRHSVRENRLTSRSISDDDVVDAIERTGRGWVAEIDGRIVGFAIGHASNGTIWALFVEPGHEGRGVGRRLHDAMVAWLWSRVWGRVRVRWRATAMAPARRLSPAARPSPAAAPPRSPAIVEASPPWPRGSRWRQKLS